MAFKKHNWMNLSREEKILEVTIRDQDGRKLDFFRCNNKKDCKNIANIIRNKYGFSFSDLKKENNERYLQKEFEEEKAFLDKEFE